MKNQSILTIGGLDAAGHSGITADRHSIFALGFNPVTLVSGVVLDDGEIAPIGAETLERQLKAFFDADKIVGMKTGLLSTRENIEAVATFFEDHKTQLHNFVVDAVLDNDDESPLLSSTAISLLKMRLLPMATLVIAYLSEAERLSGTTVSSIDDMKEAAEAIHIYGAKLVLIRADRPVEDEFIDILYDGNEHQFLFTKTAPPESPRVSRDSFASAVAAFLSKDYRVKEAIEAAKQLGGSRQLVGQERLA